MRSNADPVILSGISSYAHKQADMCTRMAKCALYWLPHLKSQGGGIMPSWGIEYEHLLVEAAHKARDDATAELDSTEDLDGDGNEMEGEEEEEVGENEYFELDDI